MTDSKSEIDQSTVVAWLQAKKYDEVLANYQGFIRKKVVEYISRFKYYSQFEHDFYHEVYLYLRSQTLPSPAFMEACKTQNVFRFYLAKCIRNRLNTLLSKERQKRMHTTGLEDLLATNEGQSQETDKLRLTTANAYCPETVYKDLQERLQTQFQIILQQFTESLPKVGHKLLLMLKVQARVDVNALDVGLCFGKLRAKAQQKLLGLLSGQQYRQAKDIELMKALAYYFKKYRKEKGDALALQRWINQYISGDKYTQGIMERLTISDQDVDFKIHNKRWFLDFVYEYFKHLDEGLIAQKTQVVPIQQKRLKNPPNKGRLKLQQG
ncbi:hypothetical protein [uncultured Microscilla sp.]|uniref:hypothetical protein n=1 Tax=uncultured Microscilla sp. TaxID=432653 RepID=UPI00261A0BF5|nr:hypothetical protein [uncultured Microscilla sp.]